MSASLTYIQLYILNLTWPIYPWPHLTYIFLWHKPSDDRWDIFVPRELTFELTRFCHVAGLSRQACMQQTHSGMHASIISHTQFTTRAGSLVYIWVGSGGDQTGEDICGPTDHFQQFWNGYGRQRVILLVWFALVHLINVGFLIGNFGGSTLLRWYWRRTNGSCCTAKVPTRWSSSV